MPDLQAGCRAHATSPWVYCRARPRKSLVILRTSLYELCRDGVIPSGKHFSGDAGTRHGSGHWLAYAWSRWGYGGTLLPPKGVRHASTRTTATSPHRHAPTGATTTTRLGANAASGRSAPRSCRGPGAGSSAPLLIKRGGIRVRRPSGSGRTNPPPEHRSGRATSRLRCPDLPVGLRHRRVVGGDGL